MRARPQEHERGTPCPCGSGAQLEQCCAPYVRGERAAPGPEALMRSRFTAFALGTAQGIDYLIATHHPEHRDPQLREGLRNTFAAVDAWEQLEVLESREQGQQGEVRFVATYRVGGRRQQLREHSHFVCEQGRWLYTEGRVS